MNRLVTIFRNFAALGLPAAYLILEFSFNHRLMTLTTDMVDEQVLQGLEFWGRLLSGIGCGLLLFRWTQRWLAQQGAVALLLRLVASLALGIALMWNVQKWITDHWVASASEDDKRAAWVLGAWAPDAAQGKLLTLAGEAMLQRPGNEAEAQLTAALFPAASLHVAQRALQLKAWAAVQPPLTAPYPGFTPSPAQLNNGFRNLIIPPLTLGFSLFFALVNLAQLVAQLLPALTDASRRWAATLLLVLLVGISAAYPSPFLDSPAYARSLRAGLWQADRALALLTEWSFRSVARWQPVSEWMHRHVLQDFAFAKP